MAKAPLEGSGNLSNTEELVVGSSVSGGEGEVRDHSESEAPNKAHASTFFLRVALDGSGSVAVLAPISVSVLNSSGVLKTFGRGACMLFTTESRRALAFDALSWDIGRCWMVSAPYTSFRPVATTNNWTQLTDCVIDGRLLRSEFLRLRDSGAYTYTFVTNISRSCIVRKSPLFNPMYCCTISSTSLLAAELSLPGGLERSCHTGGWGSSAITRGSVRSCLSASYVW